MLVDLPDLENREKILRTILAKENLVPEFKFIDLAARTEGFSGSDLKNLCISGAYMPIREILQAEQKGKEKADKASATIATTETTGFITSDMLEENHQPQIAQKEQDSSSTRLEMILKDSLGSSSSNPVHVQTNSQVRLRPLKMADFEMAMKEISASVSEDACAIAELRKWNEMYGEGGSRTKSSLSYFM